MDDEEGFGGFGDGDSLDGEGGNLEGFGFHDDDPSKVSGVGSRVMRDSGLQVPRTRAMHPSYWSWGVAACWFPHFP